MTRIRVTKEFNFDTAHALHNYDGLCKNIHGHTFKLWVTVLGTPIEDSNNTKNGMVIDFGELKKIVKDEIIIPLDHACLLFKEHDNIEDLQKLKSKYIIFDFQPTSENLVIWIVEKLKKKLPSSVSLIKVKLSETPTSLAEWRIEDQ
jgi:6-pyruvoyltetrahydropterin/6-carboxytetrahydropterin synthase